MAVVTRTNVSTEYKGYNFFTIVQTLNRYLWSRKHLPASVLSNLYKFVSA